MPSYKESLGFNKSIEVINKNLIVFSWVIWILHKVIPKWTTIAKTSIWGYKQFLNSLKGSPVHVTGNFNCSNIKLTSLVGEQQKVDDGYACWDAQITALDSWASHIGLGINCEKNNITSLVDIHKTIKSCKSFSFDSKKLQRVVLYYC